MARFKQEQESAQYRDYVATSLQLIPQRKHLTKSYSDLINPEKVKADMRSGDEIVMDVITGAGLTFGE